MKHPCPRSSSFPAPPPEHSQGGERIPTGNSRVVVVTFIVLVAAMVTSSVDRRAGAETTAALPEAQEKLVQVTPTQAMGELTAATALVWSSTLHPSFELREVPACRNFRPLRPLMTVTQQGTEQPCSAIVRVIVLCRGVSSLRKTNFSELSTITLSFARIIPENFADRYGGAA